VLVGILGKCCLLSCLVWGQSHSKGRHSVLYFMFMLLGLVLLLPVSDGNAKGIAPEVDGVRGIMSLIRLYELFTVRVL